MTPYTTEQRKAAAKIHQLLCIAIDHAEPNGLVAINADLEALRRQIEYAHREDRKMKVAS